MTIQRKAIRQDHGPAGGWGFIEVTGEAPSKPGAGTEGYCRLACDNAFARPEVR
jgi:hypothetical protein